MIGFMMIETTTSSLKLHLISMLDTKVGFSMAWKSLSNHYIPSIVDLSGTLSKEVNNIWYAMIEKNPDLILSMDFSLVCL